MAGADAMPHQDRVAPDRRTFLRRGLAAAAGPSLLGTVARGGLVPSIQEEADAFLEEYVAGWLPRETAAQEAAWTAATDVSEEHTAATVRATLAVNRVVGAPE